MSKNRLCYTLTAFLLLGTTSALALTPWTGLTKKPETKMKYFLHTGFMFEAVLRTAIFSYNLQTPVIAETEYDITFNDKVMVPKRTKIIGYASVVKSFDRVNVLFHTIVFPDGSEIKFSGMALHTDGSAGIPGKVKKHKEKIPLRILLGTAGELVAPGIGGEVARELSKETLREQEYTPTTSITVKKDVPILVYNTDRVEY